MSSEQKPFVPKTPMDFQKLKLERLMANPEKPVIIPEMPKEKKGFSVPEFVRNVMGSSAGAGSGEFHVYRHLRRKEYTRQKVIDEKAEKEKLDEEFRQKLEENKRKMDEKTEKKRAKRLKKKCKLKQKRKDKKQTNKNQKAVDKSSSEDSGDESQSDNNDNPVDTNCNPVNEDHEVSQDSDVSENIADSANSGGINTTLNHEHSVLKKDSDS